MSRRTSTNAEPLIEDQDQNMSVPDFGMSHSGEHKGISNMLQSNDQILQNHKVLRLLNSNEQENPQRMLQSTE